MHTTPSNRETLSQLVKIYIFLKLLLKEEVQLNELSLQKVRYINKSRDIFKVLSLCVEDKKHSYTYKIHNNSVVFFDEIENAKIFDINIFRHLFKQVEQILKTTKNYNELKADNAIRSFYDLVRLSDIEEVKLVLMKDDQIYNKKFKLVLNKNSIEHTANTDCKKIFFMINEPLDFSFKGLYSDKIKNQKLRNLGLSINGDIASLMALFYIKYNIKDLLTFYNKVCQVNPTQLEERRVKKHYKKEIEEVVLRYIKSHQLRNYICLQPPYNPVGFITDNIHDYSNLRKYKINLSHKSFKNNILSSHLEVSFHTIDKHYHFIEECVHTKKELEIILVKGRFYEDSLKFKTYFSPLTVNEEVKKPD